MRKHMAWLDKGERRTSNTRPISDEKWAKQARKKWAKKHSKSPVTDSETGTVSYPSQATQ